MLSLLKDMYNLSSLIKNAPCVLLVRLDVPGYVVISSNFNHPFGKKLFDKCSRSCSIYPNVHSGSIKRRYRPAVCDKAYSVVDNLS